jgi:hypothetical protein
MTAAGFGAAGVGGGGIQTSDISILPHKSEVDTVDFVKKTKTKRALAYEYINAYF